MVVQKTEKTVNNVVGKGPSHDRLGFIQGLTDAAQGTVLSILFLFTRQFSEKAHWVL